jgi:hypothetical protein
MTGSRRWFGRLSAAVLAAGSVAVSLGMTVSPGAGASVISPVKITSVKITGTVTAPVITVKGSGFGARRPTADPARHPNGQAGCPAFPASPPSLIANDGYDYGPGKLYLWDRTAGWRGGDYVPGSELDCIGLRITSWATAQIVLRPGTAYDHAKLEGGHRYILTKGDSVQVDVLGTTARITY